MSINALVVATIVGTVLQIIMVVAGHSVPFIKDNLFLAGGLVLSLVAGLIYASMAQSGWGDALLGGAIAGGVCAFIGIAVSFFLGDVPAAVLVFGTVSSAVAGAVGGAVIRLLRGGA
jgi:hypothetical protein